MRDERGARPRASHRAATVASACPRRHRRPARRDRRTRARDSARSSLRERGRVRQGVLRRCGWRQRPHDVAPRDRRRARPACRVVASALRQQRRDPRGARDPLRAVSLLLVVSAGRRGAARSGDSGADRGRSTDPERRGQKLGEAIGVMQPPGTRASRDVGQGSDPARSSARNPLPARPSRAMRLQRCSMSRGRTARRRGIRAGSEYCGAHRYRSRA